MREVAFPLCGIFAGAPVARLGKIEDHLDPAPKPGACFGNSRPDGRQHGQHLNNAERIDRLIPYGRAIGGQREIPLHQVGG